MRKILLAALLGVASVSLRAELPAADPVLEARMVKLTEELRCLVCQNQSIAESNADLAQDLRREVRELLAAGKSDADVREFMVARYGDFVLYDPPLKRSTLVLWVGPGLLFAAALGGLLWQIARRRRLREAAPDPEALARARALLNEGDAR